MLYGSSLKGFYFDLEMFLYLFNVTGFVVVLGMTVVAVLTGSVLFVAVSIFYLVLLCVFEDDS